MNNQLQIFINERKLQYALVFKDLCSGETLSFNLDKQVPSASTIKLFIMAEVLRQVKAGGLDLAKTYRITEADRVEETLECGGAYTLEELLNVMIAQSDNIAANLMIDTVGMENVNAFIQEMGISHTVLQRKMLDFAARRAGHENITTASDLAKFLELLYTGKVIDPVWSDRMLKIMRAQSGETLFGAILPEDLTIAYKGGDLEGIKHEAAVVFTPKGDYLFVVLTWGGTDEDYQREAIGRVSKAIYDKFMERI